MTRNSSPERIVKDVALDWVSAVSLADRLIECEDPVEAEVLEGELCFTLTLNEMGVDRTVVALNALTAKAKYYRDLSKELTRKAVAIEKQEIRLRGLILELMNDGVIPEKMRGEVHSISVRQNTQPILNVTEEQEQELLLRGFYRTSISLDKRQVVETLINEGIDGFNADEVLSRGFHLRIS